MKIQLEKIPRSTWAHLYNVADSMNDIELHASREPMYFALINILFEMQHKLQSKYKQLNLNFKKETSITLKYYQAYALEWYLGVYIKNTLHAGDDIPKAILTAFRMKINQKLQR